MAEERILKRNEVEKENTWAVEDIFPSDQAWAEEYELLKSLPEKASCIQPEARLSSNAPFCPATLLGDGLGG